MKIKVVTVKDLAKYLLKIGMIFGILTIIVNFFYSNKGASGYFLFDSAKFLSVIKEEILTFKENEDGDCKLPQNKYFSEAVINEISMFKAVATVSRNYQSDTQNLENRVQTKNENEQIEIAEEQKPSEESKLKQAATNVKVEVMPSNIMDKTSCEIFGVKLRDECSYNLEEEIKDLDANFNKNNILIFHTHTCESYTPTEECNYESTGNFRTTDLNYSVARVGDELEKYLKNYGYNVVHDKSYHDYPSYNGSYNRSLVTVQNLLEKYQDTNVVIDLHRDAIGDNTYAPKVKIGDEYCARLMFVIGTDGGGLTHKNWRNNLKFAMKVVQKGNEMYPRVI